MPASITVGGVGYPIGTGEDLRIVFRSYMEPMPAGWSTSPPYPTGWTRSWYFRKPHKDKVISEVVYVFKKNSP